MSVLRSASVVVRQQIRAQAVSAPRLPCAPHLRAASLAFRQHHFASADKHALSTRSFAMDVTTNAGKSRTALHETGDGGAFVRKDSVYRGWIEEGGEFPPEGDTYGCAWGLLVMHTCVSNSMHAACMGLTYPTMMPCSRALHSLHLLRLPGEPAIAHAFDCMLLIARMLPRPLTLLWPCRSGQTGVWPSAI